jgi:peroxiredoxin
VTVTEFAQVGVRVLLSAIFLIAGVAKLANPREAIQTLHDFGAPRRLRPFGVFLAPLEIIVAVGLLFAAAALIAAWGALTLLVLFIAGITVNLARGQQPPCNCFGQLHSRPISWRTLVRNGVLAAGASWLIARGQAPANADLWLFLTGLNSRGRRIATVAAAVIGFAILRALWPDEAPSEPDVDEEPDTRELATPPRRVAAPATVALPAQAAESSYTPPARVIADIGFPIGTPAPGFELPDLEGRRHSLDSLRASGTPVLLVFTSPFCESCQALAPRLPALATLHANAFRMVLISRGTVAQNLAKMKGPNTLPVLLQQDFEVAEAYDCSSTPAAVLISADGVIQSLLATGGPAIQQLIASCAPP